MSPSAARMMRTTTPMAYSGRGWSNGMAAQVRLPSISTSYLPRRRTPGRTGGPFGFPRRLLDDAVEQLGLDRAVGRRRHGYAGLCQCGVGGIVERGAGAARLRDP